MIILRHTMKITSKFIPTSCNFVNEKFLIVGHKSIVDIAIVLFCHVYPHVELENRDRYLTTISHCLALSLVPASALLPCHFSYPHTPSSSYQNDRNSDDASTVQFLASSAVFG
jgi:hypothetical protein